MLLQKHVVCTNIRYLDTRLTLENNEVAIKNGQFRKTGHKGYTGRRKTKQLHNVLETTIDKQTQLG